MEERAGEGFGGTEPNALQIRNVFHSVSQLQMDLLDWLASSHWLEAFGAPPVLQTELTLVCSFLSSFMSARFSLSFALSSRKRPTTSDVWAIQDLIALSLLRWASIICRTHEVNTGNRLRPYKQGGNTLKGLPQPKSHTRYFSYDCHTHRFIELFACLCGIHSAWEGDCGHGGVQGMDDAVVYGAHHLQHLLRNNTVGQTDTQQLPLN